MFPFRQETAEILQWAETRRPHWKTRYYLALVYLSKDRVESAQELLSACGAEPDFAPFYLVRGNLLRSQKSLSALNDFKRARELGASEWRTYRTLIDYGVERLEYADALSTAQAAARQFPSSYVALFDLGRLLVLNHLPEPSLSILDTLTVLPFEGASYTRAVHRQACIFSAATAMKAGSYQEAVKLLAKAREWPERLGAGRPYEVDNRFEDYLEGLCDIHLGNKSAGQKLFEQVAAYTQSHAGDMGVNKLFGALAERALGRESAAKKLVSDWHSDGKTPDARWLNSALNGMNDAALAAEKELRGASSVSLLGREKIDPDFALVVEVSHMVQYQTNDLQSR